MVYVLKDEYDRLENKAKFIDLVINKKLVYINRKEEDVVQDMKKHGLKQIYPRKKKNVLAVDDEDDMQVDQEGTGYEYLFSINVRGFTVQKVAELLKQKENKKKELDEIQGTPPKTFWRRDLEKLLEEWDRILIQDEEDLRNAKPLATAQTKKRKRVMKPKVKAENKKLPKAESGVTTKLD